MLDSPLAEAKLGTFCLRGVDSPQAKTGCVTRRGRLKVRGGELAVRCWAFNQVSTPDIRTIHTPGLLSVTGKDPSGLVPLVNEIHGKRIAPETFF